MHQEARRRTIDPALNPKVVESTAAVLIAFWDIFIAKSYYALARRARNGTTAKRREKGLP